MYDVVVLGGGPGGYTAAIHAAHLGGKVAIVEKDNLGGTCLNWGCIPTKALVKCAEVWRSVPDMERFGVKVENAQLNYERVINHKEQVVADLLNGLKHLMRSNKIDVYYGKGEVKDIHSIVVKKESGEQVVKGKKIIIATGSTPMKIPIPGAELDGVITSNQVLELTEVPDSMLVVGGGVVGLEMASIFNTFGSKVTVVEMERYILPSVDQEISRRLTPLLKKQGITIYTKAMVERIRRKDKLIVTLQDREEEIAVDLVLLATGRVPNLEGVPLDSLGLHHDGRRLVVNERMETNVPGIYAVGDVVGGTMLAHVAAAEGMVAAENCMDQPREFDFRAVPACIFTFPEVATVGMTEEEARKEFGDIKVSKFSFAVNGKALTLGEGHGLIKMIAHSSTGLILGVHIIGPQATELIAEAALAINARLTAEEVADTIHAHPTLAEVIGEAAHGVDGYPIHAIRC